MVGKLSSWACVGLSWLGVLGAGPAAGQDQESACWQLPRQCYGMEIDLGGLHHGPGRQEVLPYLHLGPEDRSDLRAMAKEGVDVIARDLPDSPRVSLANLLGD